MKILDKYLTKNYLAPLTYCLLAFSFIYIIYDLFDNLYDFMQAKTSLLQIFSYYFFYRIPAILIYIVPISSFLAVLYALSQLTKTNEITAMRASGVSTYRIVLPFIVMGVISSIFVGYINEYIGPRSAYLADCFIENQHRKGDESAYLARNLPFKNERERRIWFISEFDTRKHTMRRVDIIQQREDSSDAEKIQAAGGQWLDGRWWLSDLAIQRYDKDGRPIGPPQFHPKLEMNQLSEIPNDFINEIKSPQFLSSGELQQFLKSHKNISADAINRIKVDYHQRIAMPWTCLVVVLLGIPFGTHTGRKGAFLGIAISIGIFFLYYVLSNLGIAMGKKHLLTPFIAAWGFNIAFSTFGAYMIWRMR